MAVLAFPQFLKRYGIVLFPAAVANIVPACVIAKQKKGYVPIGTLQQGLGGTPAQWASTLMPANLVYGTVARTLSLEGKASLNEFGVEIGGGCSEHGR